MRRPVTTVMSELLTALHDAPPEARDLAGPLLLRGLGLVERPRDLKAERDYADTADAGYITLPAGCAIPARGPMPTTDDLNSIWAELAPSPLDGGRARLLEVLRGTR